MKKLITLLAGALCFGVVMAAETAAKDNGLLASNDVITWNKLIELNRIPAETAKAQLEEVAETVKNSHTLLAKIHYAVAITNVWHRENPDSVTSYEDLYNHFKEEFAKLNPLESLNEYQQGTFEAAAYLLIEKNVQNGKEAPKAWNEAYYNLHKDTKHPEVANSAMTAAGMIGKIDEYLRLGKLAGSAGAERLINYYFRGDGNDKAAAAAMYWEKVLQGGLWVGDTVKLFPAILAYELEQENFDAAALKSKLNKAILIYKSKARQWKPSKEGEANPYVEFVGMLQDTAKDL